MISAHSRIGLQAVPDTRRLLPAIAAALLGAIVLFGLTRGLPWKAAAVALIAIPHLIGAPHAETHSTLAPPELLQTFIVATAVTNAVFWVVLGAGCAIAFKKLA